MRIGSSRLFIFGAFFLVGVVSGGCASDDGIGTVHSSDTGPGMYRIEAVSLLGEPLTPPEMNPTTRTQLQDNLAEARRDYEAAPTDEPAIIWYGRRLAYLGRYNDAVTVFGRGLQIHPESYRLRRHLGHRLITLRRFDEAIIHLSEAARLAAGFGDEVEEDGAPNEQGIPRSTTHSNIFYHLGLAHFLNGDFDAARSAYETCMEFSAVNDDMLCATSHWLYMTYRRLGEEILAAGVLAPIHADMDVIENHAYHRALLMYRGEITPESVLAEARAEDMDFASAGFGVAQRHLVQGDEEKATALFREIVDSTGWAAFGHIASEAELARRASR